MKDLTVYNKIKVVVTGSTGFKGSWLTFIMSKLKADVYGFALEPEKISNYNKSTIKCKLCKQVFTE